MDCRYQPRWKRISEPRIKHLTQYTPQRLERLFLALLRDSVMWRLSNWNKTGKSSGNSQNTVEGIRVL